MSLPTPKSKRHSRQMTVVPYNLPAQAKNRLRKNFKDPSYKSYTMTDSEPTYLNNGISSSLSNSVSKLSRQLNSLDEQHKSFIASSSAPQEAKRQSLPPNLPNSNDPNRNEYVQLRCSSLKFGDFILGAEEHGRRNLSMHYRYLDGRMTIAMNEYLGCVSIPIEAMEAVSKVGNDSLVVKLFENRKHLIKMHVTSENEEASEGSLQIAQIIESVQDITFICNKSTPEQRIELIWLHVAYMLSRDIQLGVIELDCRKCFVCSANIEICKRDTVASELKKIPSPGEKLLIKFHFDWDNDKAPDDGIPIFEFPIFTPYSEIKKAIEETLQIPEIQEMVYKGVTEQDTEEFFRIASEHEWISAVDHISNQECMELWSHS